jgi:CheY-like chemotaxis protein
MDAAINVLLLSDDLIFTSRVTGTGRDLGLAVQSARSEAALRDLFVQKKPACLILDLSNPGLEIANLMDWLKQTGELRPRVVAYGSHVDTATLKAARAAGCDDVLTRSQFVEDLPRKLPEWVRGRNESQPKDAH